MRVLVLGGTIFLGRRLVEEALARGHEVTLFNRGQHNPDLYPEVEKLRGDRDGALDALQGRTWDVVLDPSGYVPRIVRMSAELLADACEHYTFISSISVYPTFPSPHMDETAPVGVTDDPTTEDVSSAYGPLKALCEQAVDTAMNGRALSVRAGLIVGPDDPTNRFTYWPVRVARGGDVLAPGRPERPIQVIDARDLASWTLEMAEQRTAGAFNVTGAPDTVTMGDLLATCRREGAQDARLVWATDQFLLEHGAGPWMELPLWIPESDQSMQGFMRVSVDRALATGLKLRPLSDTVRDTLAWARTIGLDALPGQAGLKPEREAELLAALRAQATG